MKKKTILSLTVCMLLIGLVGLAPAAQNVANTSQKGSLMVFPKIEATKQCPNDMDDPMDPEPMEIGLRDTIVEINNDFTAMVRVKCYWVNEAQEVSDFEFCLPPNRPAYFSARYGNGDLAIPPFNGERGELRCWAVDSGGGNQISWNHLYGSATIFDYEANQSMEYNSWNFTARNVQRGKNVGHPGVMELTGKSGDYDACPQYLVGDFVARGGQMNAGSEIVGILGTEMTLVPCIQDLRQDREATYTKAKFDLWNGFGVKYTGAYKCIKCWYEDFLHNIQPVEDPFNGAPIGGYGGDKFLFNAFHTPKGRIRVEGVASTVCETPFYNTFCPVLCKVASGFYDENGIGPEGSSKASPFLGVTVKHFDLNGEDLMSATTMSTAGYSDDGLMLYDAAPYVVPEIK